MAGFGKTTFKTNPVIDKFKRGEAAVGSWLSLCSPTAGEAMAHVGFDWLLTDAEHAPWGFENMVNTFRAVQLGGAVPMARVPWNDTVWIQRTLDAGALGLVVPMVNKRADAESVVSNMRYATKGQRSYDSSRIAPYVEGDYLTWTEENLAVMVMFETVEAVENAEVILSVDGVVGGYIGPADLALSMGISLSDVGPGTEHEAAIMAVLAACQKTGKVVGKHCYDGAEITRRIGQGFQFLALSSDAGLMGVGARQEFAAIDFSGQNDASSKEGGSLY